MPIENAIDELRQERLIAYKVIENPGKVLHCIETNTKTFDLNNEVIDFFDYFDENLGVDEILSNIIGELEIEKIASNPPEPWFDKAVSAHANALEVLNFMRRALTPEEIQDYSYNLFVRFPEPVANSFGKRCILAVYGDNSNNKSLSSSETIVAHEFYHGITAFRVGFSDENQAGALCESYSDIFAILFKNRDVNDIQNWNWNIGTEINDLSSDEIRDLSNPRASNQAMIMEEYSEGATSRYNSGIHNYAAHIIISRLLSNQEGSSQYTLTVDKLVKIFYNALETLPTKANFSQSHLAIFSAASSLEENSPLKSKIQNVINYAFNCVGIRTEHIN